LLEAQERAAKRGSQRELDAAAAILLPDECVLELGGLNTNPFGGKLLIVTNERLLFLKAGRSDQQEQSVPLSEISFIERAGKLLPKIVMVSSDRHEIVLLAAKDADRIVDSVRNQLLARGVDASKPPDTAATIQRPDVAPAQRPDVEAAIARMGWKMGGRRELRRLPKLLQDDETVLEITTGAYGRNEGNVGLLVLTDQRLLFFFDGWANSQSEDFPLALLTSVKLSSGIGNSTITILGGGQHTVINKCYTTDAKRLVDAAKDAIVNARALAQTASQTPPSVDLAGQIRQLAELKEAGILTPEEFDAKKQELLSRM
jgi:hypothetical protein